MGRMCKIKFKMAWSICVDSGIKDVNGKTFDAYTNGSTYAFFIEESNYVNTVSKDPNLFEEVEVEKEMESPSLIAGGKISGIRDTIGQDMSELVIKFK